MEKEKLQIELNNRPYSKDMIYAAVSLRGGYTTRDFIVDDSHFESNCAFYNVLFNYYRLMDEASGLHYDIQRAVSSISFYRKKTDFLSSLAGILHTLFSQEYNSVKFNIAKHNAREAFALHYKDGAFRSKHKGYEFSDLNKRFTLKQLIDDIETITFDDFVRIANTLVTPGNVCVYVSGDCSELDFSMLSLQAYAEQSAQVRIAGYGFDPYLRQDAHITNKAREDHNLIIEALDFLNGDCTNFTKLLITELLAEQVPVHEIDVWVDSFDASIMFSSEQLREYKSYLSIDTEKAYNVAHKNLLTKYASLLENSPEQFAIKASHMMSVGVYIDQYLEFLDKCSYELFVELREKVNYKITEAQIVLRKEPI